MESYWTQTQPLHSFDPLRHDPKTDVLIICGGLAGLLCAYWLRQEKVDYALKESRRICGSVTGHGSCFSQNSTWIDHSTTNDLEGSMPNQLQHEGSLYPNEPAQQPIILKKPAFDLLKAGF